MGIKLVLLDEEQAQEQKRHGQAVQERIDGRKPRDIELHCRTFRPGAKNQERYGGRNDHRQDTDNRKPEAVIARLFNVTRYHVSLSRGLPLLAAIT